MSQQWKTRGCVTKGTVALALALAALGVRPADADSGQGHPARQLEGAWYVLVSRTDCQTGAVLPGPAIPALLTFARGGTMTDSSGSPPPGFAPSQRSIGLGNWRHDRARTFTASTFMLIHFDSPAGSSPPGFLAGSQTITQEITLTDVDRFTAVASTQFFNTAGQQYRAGCSTAAGQRLP